MSCAVEPVVHLFYMCGATFEFPSSLSLLNSLCLTLCPNSDGIRSFLVTFSSTTCVTCPVFPSDWLEDFSQNELSVLSVPILRMATKCQNSHSCATLKANKKFVWHANKDKLSFVCNHHYQQCLRTAMKMYSNERLGRCYFFLFQW